jgi:acetylornithine/N-succinyldiaminopimelate aminotransferase
MDLTMTPLTNTARPVTALHDYLAPVFAQYPIEVVSAQGVWLTNSRGERVLDLYGGHAVAALGYGHTGFTRALISQAESCNFQSNAVAMQVRVRAAERLVRFSQLPLTSVFFVNSGAEANENALKLAFRMDGGSRRGDVGRSTEVVQLPANAVRRRIHPTGKH